MPCLAILQRVREEEKQSKAAQNFEEKIKQSISPNSKFTPVVDDGAHRVLYFPTILRPL